MQLPRHLGGPLGMKHNTSFDTFVDDTSWEIGKNPHKVLGINKPISALGTNIENAKYGWANLQLFQKFNMMKFESEQHKTEVEYFSSKQYNKKA